MQPLANFQLKYNDLGSTFQKRNVTPAEMLVLVSMFHHSSRDGKFQGENMIDRFKLVDEDREEQELKPLLEQIELVEKKIEDLDEEELTDEIRERRLTAHTNKLTSLQEKVKKLEMLLMVRKLSPSDEVNRLASMYGEERVSSLFPGSSPSLPKDHKEAQELGMKRKFSLGEFGDMLTVTKVKAA